MSGLLAVVGGFDSSRLDAALGRLAALGGDESMLWSDEGNALGVTRNAWELDEDFSGRVFVLERPDLVIAADASLYDRAGLMRALAAAAVTPSGSTPSHLIEAAYRAWGPGLTEHLLGDYAFVVWDRPQNRLTAARDPVGKRALYFSRMRDGLAVASSSRAVAELAGKVDDLNLASLAIQVAGLSWSSGSDTSYQDVDVVLPGHRLVWQHGRLRTERFWNPPSAPARSPKDPAEAALELQSLLMTAVTDRMSKGTTSVWMSGGWDSTAVFGAGQHALSPTDRHRLRPVSVTYPPGDPGYEDDFIKDVAARWNSEVTWLSSEEIPLLDGLEDRVATLDEPPCHLYELWNRALARGSRSIGARVALTGSGGDNLFAISEVYLADLFRTGRWGQLARLLWPRRAAGWRYLSRVCVLPNLSDTHVALCETLMGRQLPHHYLEFPVARWMRPEFVSRHGLLERERAALRSSVGSTLSQTESMACVAAPVWSWSLAFLHRMTLQEGVEMRSPLLDSRVIDFALSRPTEERNNGTDTKLLLRRAMKGLLPESVLAARTHRTGITAGLSRRRMRAAYPALVNRLFGEPLRLADLGIVDPAVVFAVANEWQSGQDESARVQLFHMMKVEFWLRGRERSQVPVGAARRTVVPMVSSAA